MYFTNIEPKLHVVITESRSQQQKLLTLLLLLVEQFPLRIFVQEVCFLFLLMFFVFLVTRGHENTLVRNIISCFLLFQRPGG